MGQSHSINVTNENEVRQLQQKYNEQIEAEISLKNLQFAQERAVKLVELRERLAWEVIALGSMATLLLAAGSIYKRKVCSCI
uniref:GOLD domain-containing protein n=1 Tax=Heterorhabditis bacteriophora TaxID=37862 RepID=A0A1I7WWQ5_HETBA